MSIKKNIDKAPHISEAKGWRKSIATIVIKSPIANFWKEGETRNHAADINSDLFGKNDPSTTNVASPLNSVV